MTGFRLKNANYLVYWRRATEPIKSVLAQLLRPQRYQRTDCARSSVMKKKQKCLNQKPHGMRLELGNGNWVLVAGVN